MVRRRFWILMALLIFGLEILQAFGQPDNLSIAQKRWTETRTAHFHIYSCAPQMEIFKLAARLEQFSEAYSLLAGSQALASPPIVVMAFPDEDSMKPFLPVYDGQPANLSGFFQRNSDENLIVLALQGTNSAQTEMNVIFHEYTHLLLRRNDEYWPLWLKEGIAEIYSTFETSGGAYVRIAEPIDHHLQLLAHEPWMSLDELFSVTHDSPQYNERTRQGIFYAESWLLTHFMMAGGNANFRAGFAQFTPLLIAGEPPEKAFTNALHASLPQIEAKLHRYFQRGNFEPIQILLPASISASISMNTRIITPVEAYFRLGDELLRIHRFDDAQMIFTQAQKLAPASPLPLEGLGLLAAAREQHDEAVRELSEALRLGSTSFLAHYIYASEKYRLTGDSQDRYAPLKNEQAQEIRGELQKSIALMPTFAPAHELLGFFEMVQGQNPALAEQQLQLAIQLEPENPAYLFSLAQSQVQARNPAAARRTLQPLLLPYIDAKLRADAEELIQQIDRKPKL